jgi:glycosyltransferase involved in cell wall biosynthesis
VYARAAHGALPPGTPVIVSDDPSVWRGIELLKGRHPLIGVLHADDASYYELASRFHQTAGAIVAVSGQILSHVQAMIEGLATRTEVIPCGIVLPPPPVDSSVAAVTRLVWVGRISERQKRVSDLVRIALALETAGHSFLLDVIGDGESAGHLQLAVHEAGLAQRVVFHGWISSPDVLVILGRSDIMLLPSNFEGMPVAAMEALGCGCAVVGSDTCGLQEYANGEAAREVLWIYRRGDISAAATAVVAAAAIARRHRRAAARRFAAQEFAIDVCMDRYEALLAHLAPASVRAVRIASWHPADMVSRSIAFARRSRSALSRRMRRSSVGISGGVTPVTHTGLNAGF